MQYIQNAFHKWIGGQIQFEFVRCFFIKVALWTFDVHVSSYN